MMQDTTRTPSSLLSLGDDDDDDNLQTPLLATHNNNNKNNSTAAADAGCTANHNNGTPLLFGPPVQEEPTEFGKLISQVGNGIVPWGRCLELDTTTVAADTNNLHHHHHYHHYYDMEDENNNHNDNHNNNNDFSLFPRRCVMVQLPKEVSYWIITAAGTCSVLHLGLVWGSLVADAWMDSWTSMTIISSNTTTTTTSLTTTPRSNTLASLLQDLDASGQVISWMMLWMFSLLIPCLFVVLSPAWVIQAYSSSSTSSSQSQNTQSSIVVKTHAVGTLRNGLELTIRFAMTVVWVFVVMVQVGFHPIQLSWTNTTVQTSVQYKSGILCFAAGIACAITLLVILRVPVAKTNIRSTIQEEQLEPVETSPEETTVQEETTTTTTTTTNPIRAPPPHAFRLPWKKKSKKSTTNHNNTNNSDNNPNDDTNNEDNNNNNNNNDDESEMIPLNHEESQEHQNMKNNNTPEDEEQPQPQLMEVLEQSAVHTTTNTTETDPSTFRTTNQNCIPTTTTTTTTTTTRTNTITHPLLIPPISNLQAFAVFQVTILSVLLLVPVLYMPLLELHYTGIAASLMPQTNIRMHIGDIPYYLSNNAISFGIVLINTLLAVLVILLPLIALGLTWTIWLIRICSAATATSSSRRSNHQHQQQYQYQYQQYRFFGCSLESCRNWLYTFHPAFGGGMVFGLALIIAVYGLEYVTKLPSTNLWILDNHSKVCQALTAATEESCLIAQGNILWGGWLYILQSILLEVLVILTLKWN